MKKSRIELLLEGVSFVNGCMICHLTPSQVYANIKGYGKAHRYVWEHFNGPIPQYMLVCHSCDVPRCINLEHLFLGTSDDNMQDKVAKGRQHFGGPPKLISIEKFPLVVKMRYEGATYEDIGQALLVSRRSVKRLLESCPHD